MRLRTVILLLVLAGCDASEAPPPEEDDPLLGTWEGTSILGQPMSFSFKSGGKVTVTVAGAERHGTYRLDESEDPAHFDIKLSDRREINTILQFLDDDTFEYVEVTSSDPRPTDFNEHVLEFRREE